MTLVSKRRRSAGIDYYSNRVFPDARRVQRRGPTSTLSTRFNTTGGPVYSPLLLLATAGLLLSNASGFIQQDCRICDHIPATCSDNRTLNIRHCSVNMSSCNFKSCDKDQECLHQWIGNLINSSFDWLFASGCSNSAVVNASCVPRVDSDDIDIVCRTGSSSLGCCDNETVIRTEEFSLPPNSKFVSIIRIIIAQSLFNQLFCHIPATSTPATSVTVTTNSDPKDDNFTTYVALGAVFSIALLIVIVLLGIFCLHKLRSKSHASSTPNPALHSNFTAPTEPLSWQLLERIGHGRYGYVYRADFHGDIVAVKVYAGHGRSAFEAEQNLYSMESTAHTNVLEYIASEVRGEGITLERVLLTRYYPLGSLDSYLRTHVVSWQVACVMIRAVARGLTHLHSEYYTHSSGIVAEKYPVAHR